MKKLLLTLLMSCSFVALASEDLSLVRDIMKGDEDVCELFPPEVSTHLGSTLMKNHNIIPLILAEIKPSKDFLKTGVFTTSAAFNAEGNKVVATCGDGTVKIVDENGICLTTLPHKYYGISMAQWSPKGTHIVLAGTSGATIVELGSNEEGTVLPESKDCFAAYFNATGDKIATAAYHEAAIFDLKTGKKMILKGHTDAINGIRFSHTGDLVLTSSEDCLVKLWDAKTGKELKTFEGHCGPVRFGKFFPNDKKLLTCAEDDTLKIWDVESGSCLKSYDGPGLVLDVSIDNISIRVLSGGYEPVVYEIQEDGLVPLVKMKSSMTGLLTGASFSPQGVGVLSVHQCGSAYLWDDGLLLEHVLRNRLTLEQGVLLNWLSRIIDVRNGFTKNVEIGKRPPLRFDFETFPAMLAVFNSFPKILKQFFLRKTGLLCHWKPSEDKEVN